MTNVKPAANLVACEILFSFTQNGLIKLSSPQESIALKPLPHSLSTQANIGCS